MNLTIERDEVLAIAPPPTLTRSIAAIIIATLCNWIATLCIAIAIPYNGIVTACNTIVSADNAIAPPGYAIVALYKPIAIGCNAAD